jgi:pimeloyl-ACP methyl ester carboxylesterase
MHLHRTMLVAAALFVTASALSPTYHSTTAEAASARPPVYLFRGGLDIFSTGLDDLARKLNAKGIKAVSENFTRWHGALEEVSAAYKAHRDPIVIVGHSWGADTALLMAYELGKENIPVALLILFDPTSSARVSANVRRVIDFRSSTAMGNQVTVTGTSHFTGKIDNIDVPDANHNQLEERDDLHAQAINAIRRAMSR